jgi:excisionase family DNA binding protein
MNGLKPKWNYKQAAEFLGVSEQKLRTDVMNRSIPFTKLGRSVRFDPDTLQNYFEDKTYHPGGSK